MHGLCVQAPQAMSKERFGYNGDPRIAETCTMMFLGCEGSVSPRAQALKKESEPCQEFLAPSCSGAQGQTAYLAQHELFEQCPVCRQHSVNSASAGPQRAVLAGMKTGEAGAGHMGSVGAEAPRAGDAGFGRVGSGAT